MKTLTAVLLAGGESRRMGADKATLIYAGEPLWARQLATLKKLSPDKIFVSARTKPAWCPAEIEIVLDEPPARGPLGGLVAALKKCRTTHLLALAVDLPQMNADCLRKLFAAAGDGFGAVIKGNFYEPLCAVYPANAEVLTLFADHASSGNQALQPLVEILVAKNYLRVLPRSEFDAKLFANWNTPDALA
jgi:molybdopterin-guanine dinucleotide biosynthesis protein A